MFCSHVYNHIGSYAPTERLSALCARLTQRMSSSDVAEERALATIPCIVAGNVRAYAETDVVATPEQVGIAKI